MQPACVPQGIPANIIEDCSCDGKIGVDRQLKRVQKSIKKSLNDILKNVPGQDRKSE
jgi:hypothetical protein